MVYSENETLKQQILELKEKLETADNALQYKESSTANGHHHDDKVVPPCSKLISYKLNTPMNHQDLRSPLT